MGLTATVGGARRYLRDCSELRYRKGVGVGSIGHRAGPTTAFIGQEVPRMRETSRDILGATSPASRSPSGPLINEVGARPQPLGCIDLNELKVAADGESL